MKSEKENEKDNLRSATEGDACQSKNEMGVAIGVDNEVIEKGHSGELLSEEITTGLDEIWGEE